MDIMLRILKDHPFMAGASRELVETFAHCATSVHFEPDTVILREGDKAEAGYLLVDGTVAIEAAADDGSPVRIETIGAGELLGWSWLFPPHRWHYGARSLTAVHAVRLGGPCLLDKFAQSPAVGYEAMQRVAPVFLDRLRHTRMRLVQTPVLSR
jgi:CRP/FNR family transcriptional regulator, cyclic AMP receptor protein